MRQTGVLAGSVAYALTHNLALLPKVHALAKRLQVGLEELQVGILSPAETCMVKALHLTMFILKWFNDMKQVFYDPSTIGLEYCEIAERAAALPRPITVAESRLVVHIQTSPEAVEDFLSLIKTLKQEKIDAGVSLSKERLVNSDGMKNIYVRNTRSST